MTYHVKAIIIEELIDYWYFEDERLICYAFYLNDEINSIDELTRSVYDGTNCTDSEIIVKHNKLYNDVVKHISKVVKTLLMDEYVISRIFNYLNRTYIEFTPYDSTIRSIYPMAKITGCY